MNINKHKNEKKFVDYLLIKISCRILAMSNGNSDTFINNKNKKNGVQIRIFRYESKTQKNYKGIQ